jgi:spore protease
LHCEDSFIRDEKLEVEALSEVLRGFIPEHGRILVAGLGNENITPDSLGVRAASRVVATAHFKNSDEFRDLGMREVYVVETGVLAQTGMESGEQLKFIADGIKPDMAVIIDSLACAETERLGRTIQITDTGIAPGSGVGNARREVSRKTLGVPVVAIGVPTVIDWQGGDGEPEPLMVTPRDIDAVINHYAKIIAKALNKVLIPSLTEGEIERLRF